jgi:hypothetical protein
MMRRLAFAFVALLAMSGAAWAQTGAGPVGHPQGGGQLPQDEDTISPLIAASTTHTQAGATLCTQTICVVNSASASDAIAIRQCTMAPMRVLVVNISANTIQVYGSGTDTINGIATGTGIAQVKMTSTIQTGVVEYVCVVGGTAAQWVTH